MSVFDSFGRSISTVVDERLSSPLVSSFVIAWTLINYKFFVVLISDTTVTQTFELIRQICFPDWQAWVFRGFLYPLIAAGIYIFLLPYPSQFVYEHWRKHQQATNKIKFRYDEQGYETVERARQLRARNRELEGLLKSASDESETLKSDIRAIALQNQELKALPSSEADMAELKEASRVALAEMAASKEELRARMNQFEADNVGRMGEIAALKATLESRQQERAKLQQELSKVQMTAQTFAKQAEALQNENLNLQGRLEKERLPVDDDTPSARILAVLRKEGLTPDTFDETQLLVLESLSYQSDPDRDEVLGALPELTPVHVDYALAELQGSGYIEDSREEFSDEALYRLTQRGRRVLVRLATLKKNGNLAS